MGVFVRILNGCVSFVAFITATALVLFMLIGFASSTYDIVLLMLDTLFLDPAERQAAFTIVNAEFLHTIAVLIILMKAYRILVEYMKHHHIDIKYVVEIAIIASVLELLFNAGQYSQEVQLAFLGLGLGFLAIYAFRYDVLKQAMIDTHIGSVPEIEASTEDHYDEVEPNNDEEEVEVPKPAPKKRAPRKLARKTTTRKTSTRKQSAK